MTCVVHCQQTDMEELDNIETYCPDCENTKKIKAIDVKVGEEVEIRCPFC